MDDQQGDRELISMTYTWTIDNFSKLKTRKHYSDDFVVGDFKWRIVAYPKGSNGKQYLSLYLNVADASKLPSGWTRYAQFSLTVINQFNPDKSITIDTEYQFSAKKSDWGFTSFMPLSELFDKNEGYLVDDMCIVEGEVVVSKADIEALKDQEHELESQSSDVHSVKYSEASSAHASLCSEQNQQTLPFQDTLISDPVETNVDFVQVPPLKVEVASTDQVLPYQETDSPVGPPIVEERDEDPVGELINFRGLGKIDKAFVPLLEEVCLWHPLLISCQSKRSRMFSEWAFTALGRILHFLSTTKVKDMMEDSCEHDPCEHLQVLWEEVEIFGFDLSWLGPFVRSALGIKKFGEREGVLKKLTDDVDALETKVRMSRERLAVAEEDHTFAKRDLAKAEECFGEANINSKLSYGRH